MTDTSTIQNKLHQRLIEGNLRHLIVKKGLIDFVSNDYLGLARNQHLHALIHESSKNISNGSTGSRLLSGNSEYIEEVERSLAENFRAESALIFNSGYMANLALFSSLPQRGDTVIYDELCHACIKDGIRLSLADKLSFRHNDLQHLEMKLKKATGNIYLAVESIYSMDGDECPLEDIIRLADKYDANVIIDEAHATGIIGRNGGGVSIKTELSQKLLARIYTFGKAMGNHGGVVVGPQELRTYLVNFARPFIYSTAPSPYAVNAMQHSVNYLNKHEELIRTLYNNLKLFKKLYKERVGNRYEIIPSDHPIQSIVIPGNTSVKHCSETLQKKGFDVRPILSPTVRKGTERLRICLHTFNSTDEISGLIDSLAAI